MLRKVGLLGDVEELVRDIMFCGARQNAKHRCDGVFEFLGSILWQCEVALEVSEEHLSFHVKFQVEKDLLGCGTWTRQQARVQPVI